MLSAAAAAAGSPGSLTALEMDEPSIDLDGSQCTGISLSPTGSRIAVAGRDVFKIVGFQDGGFVELQNLRTARSNLTWSCSDVDWHNARENVLATGTTNSQVCTWDLNSATASRPVLTLKQHSRTVNRVAWSLNDPNMLLSASQDSDVLLWDTRSGQLSLRFADKNSSAVRDVKFNRHFTNMFIAGHENGIVQVWDVRKNSAPTQMFSAHHELVLTVDWHPTNRHWLATGSRDKTVKVWNLNDTSRALHTVQTIGAVHRCQWRPGFETHIATCGLLLDSQIHIWDVTRPFIPIATLQGHRTDVTGIQWRRDNPHRLVSCSKQSHVRQHNLAFAYRPFQHIRPFGLAWSARDALSVVGDRIDRDAENFGKVPPAVVQQKQAELSRVRVFPPHTRAIRGPGAVTMGFDAAAFTHFARAYRLRGGTPAELCAYNAKVAQEINELQVAKTWDVLALLLDPSFGGGLLGSAQALGIDADTTETEGDLPRMSMDSDAAASGFPAPSDSSDTESGLPIPIPSPIQPLEAGSELGAASEKRMSVRVSSSSSGGLNLGSLASAALEDVLAQPAGVPPAAGAFGGHASLLMGRTLPAAAAAAAVTAAASPAESARPASHHSAVAAGPSLAIRSFSAFSLGQLLDETLEYYTERGDVQMCVALATVLDKVHPVPEARMARWEWAYVELLQRLQLWTEATEFYRHAKDADIRKLNTRSTYMSTKCPHCKQPLAAAGWACPSCHRLISPCIVCQTTVKGLFAWCQGCGHGGHLHHMRQWFDAHTECPAGCGHVCQTMRARPRTTPTPHPTPITPLTPWARWSSAVRTPLPS